MFDFRGNGLRRFREAQVKNFSSLLLPFIDTKKRDLPFEQLLAVKMPSDFDPTYSPIERSELGTIRLAAFSTQ